MFGSPGICRPTAVCHSRLSRTPPCHSECFGFAHVGARHVSGSADTRKPNRERVKYAASCPSRVARGRASSSFDLLGHSDPKPSHLVVQLTSNSSSRRCHSRIALACGSKSLPRHADTGWLAETSPWAAKKSCLKLRREHTGPSTVLHQKAAIPPCHLSMYSRPTSVRMVDWKRANRWPSFPGPDRALRELIRPTKTWEAYSSSGRQGGGGYFSTLMALASSLFPSRPHGPRFRSSLLSSSVSEAATQVYPPALLRICCASHLL